MTPKTRNCERCWLKGRQITPALYHIDDQDLCRPCAVGEGYDVSQYAPIEQPKPVEIAAPQTSAQVPVLANDVLGVARRRRVQAQKVERTRVKSEPLAEVNSTEKESVMGGNPEEVRTCSEPGCTTVLKANNKSGRCTAHFYVKKGRRPVVGRKVRVKKPATLTAAAALEAAGVATIQVSEQHLDLFFSRLPLKDKAEIVTQYFARS